MPQLDPTWFASQLFWLVITFLALYTILARFVLPPLQEVLARRASTVEGDISQAQSLKSQAEQARLEYERTLAEARAKAQSLMDETTAAYKAKSEVAAKDMDKQIEAKLASASNAIASKKQEMLSSLAPATNELATLIVDKLLGGAEAGDVAPRKARG